MTDFNSPSPENAGKGDDPGPGCLPGLIAGMVLAGIMGAVFCAGSTYWLFQQRTEFAIRTIAATEPQIEQSYLTTDEKADVISQLQELSEEMQRGNYTNAESSGAMSNLVRLPLTQWGELNVVEAWVRDNDDAKDESLKTISRLRRAVETGNATNMDFEEVLRPASDFDTDTQIRLIRESLDEESVAMVLAEADRIADRAEIPDAMFEDVSLAKIVRRQIEAGLNSGR